MKDKNRRLVALSSKYASDETELASRIFVLENEDEDPEKLLDKITEDAVKDGFCGFVSDIGTAYFSRYGLTEIGTDALTVLPNTYEGAGNEPYVRLAVCRDCSAFEEGTCYKYSGRVNGNELMGDCIHGTEGYLIAYGKHTFGPFIPRDDKITGADILAYILKASYTDEKLLATKQDMLDAVAEDEDGSWAISRQPW